MNTKVLNNPFVVSKSIPDECFCDREKETDALIKMVVNGKNVVLVAPRRMGKTGLIHHLFRQSEIANNYYTFFIDIYALSSLREMSYVLGRAVYERLKDRKEKILEQFFKIIKSLRAGFRIDNLTGDPKFEVSIGSIYEPLITLEEIIAFLEQADKPCIVAIDEFQQIAEFQDKNVEAILRGVIQNCSNTTFVFSGSRQHTISRMFQSKSKPFYQSAQMMSLDPLDKEVYTEFSERQFRNYGKKVLPEVVERVYDTYEGTTFYLQILMNELFSMTGEGEVCTTNMIGTAVDNILDLQEGIFISQLSMMSPKQKQVLQALSYEGVTKSVTSASFIKKYSLESASSVQSAIKGLNDKEIITSSPEGIKVSDYFFEQWLKKNY